MSLSSFFSRVYRASLLYQLNAHLAHLFQIVLVVNYVVQDGKSNWLEGFLLMRECSLSVFSSIILSSILLVLYVILSLTFWFYPGAIMSVAFSHALS